MNIPRLAIPLALPLALALSGCSDPTPDESPDAAGMSDAAQPDAAPADDPPTVRVAYPPPISMTGENTITIRGTASDPDGVAAIRVNGTLADTQNDFADWQATVPLMPGDNALVVDSEDTSGNVTTQAAAVDVVHWANYLREPVDLAVDMAANQTYIFDRVREEVIRMDLATAQFTVISGATLGTGPLVQEARAIGLHPGTNTVYLIDRALDALLAIDIATGDRTVVSDATTGAGFPLLHPIDMELDIANDRAIVLNYFTFDDWRYGVVYAIDLGTGDRTLIGGDDECIMKTPDVYDQMGECAPTAAWPTSLGYDPVLERAWIFEGPDEDDSIDIVSLDLVTATMTTWPFSQTDAEVIRDPVAIMPDSGNQRVLFAEQVNDAIMAMDEATGLNSYVSGGGVGVGRILGMPVSMRLDAVNSQAWVLNDSNDSRGVFTVDLTSGDRSYLQPTIGNGVELAPDALYVDVNNGLLLGTNGPNLIAIDRANGNRAVLTEFTTPVPIPPGNNAARHWLRDMAVDDANGHIYILNEWEIFENSADPFIFAEGARILDYDLNSDTYVVLSENGVSAGPDFGHLESLVLDIGNARLLLPDLDSNSILAVDLATGARSVLSDATTGAGPAPQSPVAMTMDTANGRALYVDNATDTLIAVDLASGDRTELSGPTMGSGTGIDRVVDMVLDADNGRALIAPDGLFGPSHILAVDLATGDRSIVSDNGTHPGPGLQNIRSLVLEPADDIIYVSDWRQVALLAVDARTGVRVVAAR